MCGINGYFGSFNPAQLRKANNTISHRGPDSEGTWFSSNSSVGLGHRRLSILDTSSAGKQPMISSSGEIVMVFNGEIYNFKELRANLKSMGHSFKSSTDTEVLITLYMQYQEEMLNMLNGIFAFAIFDRNKDSLFIARDAFGVKPLYYTENSRGFSFSSEIKALLHLVPEQRSLDIPSLHRYLSFLWCPDDGTPLKGVRKFLPGEAAIITNGKVSKRWKWYQLPIFRKISSSLTKNDAITKTTDILRQAVKRQLISDVPVGAFLSGGLDSSAIVAFAREEVPNIQCFTIETLGGQDNGATDDLPYAKQVAKHLKVPLNIVTVNASDMAHDIEKMVAQLDEPLADPAPLNVLYISQKAREQGIKVLLSGSGGDDLFTGYRRHVAVNYEHYWNWLPRPTREYLETLSDKLDQQHSYSRRLVKLLNGAGMEGNERIANYFSWIKESEVLALYTPEFREQLGEEKAIRPLLDFLAPLPAATKPLDKMLALEQRFFLTDHNLNYTDKMSMAAGVEVRVPFLDFDLVEHAAQIPLKFKQHGKTGKWVLKKAMEPYLPYNVIYRPKSGFGAPLRRWMQHELHPLLSGYLSEESLKRRGLFNPDVVQKLIARNHNGEIDASYILLSLLNIEIWCRTYLDTPP